MPRRVSIIFLFAAWFCASGAMLDVVQVFAWARMFTTYARSMPVEEAALETMDSQKPCSICLAVQRARDCSKDQQPPAAIVQSAERLLLTFQEIEPLVFGPDRQQWPETHAVTAGSRREPVPVPPPRALGNMSTV